MSDRWDERADSLEHTTKSHLLTRVDSFDLAFPVEHIISVHEAPMVFPVPAAQPGVLGAVKVRGDCSFCRHPNGTITRQ